MLLVSLDNQLSLLPGIYFEHRTDTTLISISYWMPISQDRVNDVQHQTDGQKRFIAMGSFLKWDNRSIFGVFARGFHSQSVNFWAPTWRVSNGSKYAFLFQHCLSTSCSLCNNVARHNAITVRTCYVQITTIKSQWVRILFIQTSLRLIHRAMHYITVFFLQVWFTVQRRGRE